MHNGLYTNVQSPYNEIGKKKLKLAIIPLYWTAACLKALRSSIRRALVSSLKPPASAVLVEFSRGLLPALPLPLRLYSLDGCRIDDRLDRACDAVAGASEWELRGGVVLCSLFRAASAAIDDPGGPVVTVFSAGRGP